MTVSKLLLRYFIIFTIVLSTTLACSKSDTTNAPEAPETSMQDDDEPEEPENNEEPEEQNLDEGSLNPEQATSGLVRDISSMELVKEMGFGWNLGNSMDVEAKDKTFWGNPLPTEQMIDAIAERGFRTLRIPITWGFHQGDAPDYTIESEFLDGIQELINHALENGMHVIINTHHDDPWIIPTYSKADEVKLRLSSLWKQVAERFIDYGDYLIFETLNEPRHEGSALEWQGGTNEERDVVNQYHKASLDAIRATGGNNAKRHIMIAPYAASSSSLTMNALELPNDDPNIIVSIHSYFPFDFTLNQAGTANWGTDQNKSDLKNELDRIHNKWVVLEKRPVILGEWGATFKNNPEARKVYAMTYVYESTSRGMPPILWDNGLQNELGVFDRNNISWSWHPDFVAAIVGGDD